MVPISLVVLFVWFSKLMLIKASSEVFHQCIKSPKPNVIKCIGQQTISSLHSLDKMDNFTIVSGLEVLRPDDSRQRSLTEFFVEDPTDFRGILENAGTMIGQRSLQWDLGIVEPGLCLRVGPTSDANSVLEFVMDPNQDRGDRYSVDEPSTARILTRQFVVPFLLGIKFNLMTILPLLFAGIILLLKKAVFLGKFAMFITGVLGFGNLLSIGQFNGVNYQPNRPFGFGNGGFGGGFGSHNHHSSFGPLSDTHGSGGLSGGYYKSGAPISFNEFVTTEKDPPFADQFYNFEKKMLSNKSDKSFDKDTKLPIAEQSGRSNTQRNFVWQSR
ncbi:uncharacterized protein LOC129567496 [Sitodiplosis mosellana]|uniref:uncharacterized protein LOC129567496 n=1 Tax=Sitodiplosis mosellana TaxID=263140 RepID=UPI002444465A|nr:uncharacterized protein LOC129567496 [Sitodiplosis mosellana]